MNPPETTGSIHTHYNQTVKPYHVAVAELVRKYTRSDGSILDIGPGVGHTLNEVRSRMPQLRISAADIDTACLDLTESKVELDRRIFIQDLSDLHPPEFSFDTVIMSHTLEHIPRPVDAVRIALELLVPQGYLILAVPNPVRPTVLLASLRRRRSVNPGHVFAWDRSHWMNFLENILDLNVIEYAQDFLELPLLGRFGVFRPLEIWLARCFPWLAYSNIAVVQNRKLNGSSAF